MKKYRVECNYGCKYFDTAAEAFAFFNKCKSRNRDVEIWQVDYCFMEVAERIAGTQELLEYSFTNLPKS